jgi:hypothetical protein
MDVELMAAVTRTDAFVLFALCAYGAMVVLAGCALTVGVLTISASTPSGGEPGNALRKTGRAKMIAAIAPISVASGWRTSINAYHARFGVQLLDAKSSSG